MRDGRHAGQQVLERADEQPRRQRMRAVRSRIAAIVLRAGRRSSIHCRRVLVAVPLLEAAVVIQLEVIVRVDQTRQDERAIEIDDEVAGTRRLVDAEDTRGKAQRPGERCR